MSKEHHDLEILALAHVTKSTKSLDLFLERKITTEHFTYVPDGDSVSYTQGLFNMILKYYEQSGGSLFTSYILDQKLKNKKVKESSKAKLLTLWEDIENWNSEDIYRRMEFGLKCSYAHGTKAIRTHLDSGGTFADISWEVFKTLQKEWSDRLILQAVSLVTLEEYLTPAGEKLADKVAEFGGILGGVAYMNPEIDRQIERVFKLAKERDLDLDFHVDENGDPDSITLKKVAETALKSNFSGKIVCGHCCSLAVQSPQQVNETIALVKQAGIGVISLPMCNLYLQDRQYQDNLALTNTPRWRGVTLLHELKQSGISVAVASDNCRDPFYHFGDHDGLEVFKMAVRIAHFDHPFGDWPQTVTRTSADLMGLSTVGRIGVRLPADLIIFKGRSFSELLSRSQHDRIVLRHGKEIDTTVPDYQELD
jgi:cytosine deaminase